MTRAAEAAKQRKIERLTKKLKSNSEVLDDLLVEVRTSGGVAHLPNSIKKMIYAMTEENVAIINHLQRLGVK